ncbi:MAG: CpaD family pilus assembly protein [Sphingorhabdus sp.]
MQKHKYIIAASLAFTLAGCGAMGDNTSLYSVNQPVVTRTNYAIDLNLDSSGVSGPEKTRVSEWFDALDLGYGDRIALDFGGGYPSAAARQDVANLAAERGMLLTATAPVTQGNVHAGTVRVVVTRSEASVPNCPNWSKYSDANYNSYTHPNYGCATNSNLASMVADAEDLVRGKEAGPNDSGSGNEAVNKHRAKTSGENP